MNIKTYMRDTKLELEEDLTSEILEDLEERVVINPEEYESFQNELKELVQMKKDLAIIQTERHLARIKHIANLWHLIGLIALVIVILLVVAGVLLLADFFETISSFV